MLTDQPLQSYRQYVTYGIGIGFQKLLLQVLPATLELLLSFLNTHCDLSPSHMLQHELYEYEHNMGATLAKLWGGANVL